MHTYVTFDKPQRTLNDLDQVGTRTENWMIIFTFSTKRLLQKKEWAYIYIFIIPLISLKFITRVHLFSKYVFPFTKVELITGYTVYASTAGLSMPPSSCLLMLLIAISLEKNRNNETIIACEIKLNEFYVSIV